MSFIANQSAPHASDEADVTNDGWFPDVSAAHVRDVARLDGTVTAPRLRQAIITAVADVNQELAEWKALHFGLGVLRLADVPGPKLAGECVWCVHYLNALLAHVHASLAERYRDFDTTGTGDKKAEALTETVAEHRRNQHWAISAIRGTPRSTVELI